MTPVAVIAEAWAACTVAIVAWIAVVLHVGKRRDDRDRARQDACDVTPALPGCWCDSCTEAVALVELNREAAELCRQDGGTA